MRRRAHALWEPLTGRSSDAGQPADLLDVESATRVFQLDGERIDMAQPFFNVNFVRPGAGAELSPGGDLRADPRARSSRAVRR